MSDRFHFNPETGRVNKCNAKVRCRFGQSEAEHGATKEQARANYEAHMATLTFAGTIRRDDSKKNMSRKEISEVRNELVPDYEYSFVSWKNDIAQSVAIRTQLEEEGVDSSRFAQWELKSNNYYVLSEDKKRIVRVFPDRRSMEDAGYYGAATVERRELEANAYARIKAAQSKDSEYMRKAKLILEREKSWKYYPVPHKPQVQETPEEIKAQAEDFRRETGYEVEELVEHRGLTMREVEEAEISNRGIIWVKIPSSSEVALSTGLVRYGLEKLEEEKRARRGLYGF